MKPSDFSNRRYFPGTTGNVFDTLLHRVIGLENLPALVFAGILFIIAVLPHPGAWLETMLLWMFFLVDWGLLAALPRAGKSFGPARPPVVILAVLRAVVAVLPLTLSLPIQLIGLVLVVYGFWIEPHSIRVTRQTLHSPKLRLERPLRVLHIGDLHVERITGRERQLTRLIRELHPDLILFSGDFINLSYLRDPVSWQAAREVLREWSAPLGVFAVTGSPAVDLPEIIPQILAGTPVCWLQDRKIKLDGGGQQITLVGLNCSHKPFVDLPNLLPLMEGEADGFTVLLYHSPDLAPDAAQTGVDLQLSGHTHGGQVRLPLLGALYAGSLYGKQFEAGRYQLGDMTLYVSRGVGMEGAAAPRIRFLCPPEIVLWEISGDPSQ